jgi:hypothetical protein
VDGAPDLRIEQCGDRVVDVGGGTIADARADGTEAATYEQNVFVLRPVGIPGSRSRAHSTATGACSGIVRTLATWSSRSSGSAVRVTCPRAGTGCADDVLESQNAGGWCRRRRGSDDQRWTRIRGDRA